MAAAVLAGGRASRFGSDKALALFAGEPLLGRTLRLLGKQVLHLSVVAKAEGALKAKAQGMLDKLG